MVECFLDCPASTRPWGHPEHCKSTNMQRKVVMLALSLWLPWRSRGGCWCTLLSCKPMLSSIMELFRQATARSLSAHGGPTQLRPGSCMMSACKHFPGLWNKQAVSVLTAQLLCGGLPQAGSGAPPQALFLVPPTASSGTSAPLCTPTSSLA